MPCPFRLPIDDHCTRFLDFPPTRFNDGPTIGVAGLPADLVRRLLNGRRFFLDGALLNLTREYLHHFGQEGPYEVFDILKAIHVGIPNSLKIHDTRAQHDS